MGFFEEFATQMKKDPAGELNPYSAMTQGTKKELFDRFRKCFKDPVPFLEAVRTQDEADPDEPLKNLPMDKEYLQYWAAVWNKERFIAVPKSRRMIVSWSSMALITWEVTFHSLLHWALVSKKEDDSDKLVRRCKFILDNLDEELFPKDIRPEYETKFCQLSINTTKSIVEGFPSGADQLRQHGFSGIFGDECAFWGNAEEMYKGATPTLQSSNPNARSKFVMVSSKAPGWFKRLVFDKFNHIGEFSHEEATAELHPRELIPGLQVWRNPGNGFFVFYLNYRADPVKRNPKWIEVEKKKYPDKDWNQEMEDAWESYAGLPVYGQNFNRDLHVRTDLEPQIGLPMLRGWDFGMTPACVVGQMQGNQLVIFKEFVEFNMGTDRFSDIVVPQCNLLYPGFKWIDFVDPAGFNRDQSDEGQATMILDQKGLYCIPGEMTFEKRRKAVVQFLTGLDPASGEATFHVDPINCPTIVRGFNGGYRYSDNVIDREPSKIRPLKDEHSHPHDALQYLASGLLKVQRSGTRHRSVPTVSYNSETKQLPETDTSRSRSYY